ncbi:ribosomal RNA small subunit methyltransferase G [mine drainage metagenome]|uniref:Ribosomal RNA small subunit methyltransferase G n=1 Tax=mine drainage metagenome TaxID=410659 RepID=A0A1J5PGP2_9ZZZZ
MTCPHLPPHLDAPLARYLDLLDQWNQTHALTALPRAVRAEELLLDAAALLPWLAPLTAGSRVADFGTGMGIPAVVIALARPELQVLAVDASAKKLAFVRQACLELPIPNLLPVQGRLEALAPLAADLGVAKALGSFEQLLGWWQRHGRPGSRFLALKGPDWQREPVPAGWTATPHPYVLPTRGSRTVVELAQK